MQNLVGRYLTFTKRWTWLLLIGIVLCGGATYIFSKFTPPSYQATSLLVLNVDTSSSNNTLSSVAAVPTYAQLVTNPLVLNTVVAKHAGMTLTQLNNMLVVKPQSNTQIIEIDVQNRNPQLAAQIANEVGASFIQYVSLQLSGTIQMLPASVPSTPVKPKPLQDAGIGALVGLSLALALSIVVEWLGDHPTSAEEVQELLGMDILTVIPTFTEKTGSKVLKKLDASQENFQSVATLLNIAQMTKPFKVCMVTSTFPGEGKSTVAINLASSLALEGKRTLLIDANWQGPVLDQRLHLQSVPGLSNALQEHASRMKIEFYYQRTAIQTLWVLTAGVAPDRSAALLQTASTIQLFKLLQNEPFDYIIIDTPALFPVIDTQVLATYVHAHILVVDAIKCTRHALKQSRKLLEKINTMPLGVVVNKSNWHHLSSISQHAPFKSSSLQQEFYNGPLSSNFLPPLTTDTPKTSSVAPNRTGIFVQTSTNKSGNSNMAQQFQGNKVYGD